MILIPRLACFLFLASLLAAASCTADPSGDGPLGDEAKQMAAASGFAVVELFSSEGCSRCPPADAVLAELESEARRDDIDVYTLGFHVDYWDRLGWNDPYSDAAYSQRQREYGEALGLANVYTPQMIVNGKREFNGANGGAAKRSIQAALAEEPTAAVRVQVTRVEDAERGYQVAYRIDGNVTGGMLRVAVVESGLSTQVERGENRGRTLKHENVVRLWKSLPLEGDAASGGVTRIELPQGVDAARASVVVYVQDAQTMRVWGAAGADLVS